MNPMNNRQKYLAWLRTYAPTLYAQAIRNATGQNRSLGGLTDDLLSSALAPNLAHSFLGDDTMLDPITVTATPMAPLTDVYSSGDFLPGDLSLPAFDPTSVGPAPTLDSGSAVGLPAPAAATATPAASSSTFTNILAAVTAIGAGVINASNQSKLVQLNTTRAQQGLPPVDATGRVIPGTALATTNPTLLAFERSISGASGSILPILAVLGIGAFFILRKRSA